MGTNNDKNSGSVNLNIELLKTCYFPGELINGILILTPKPGINDAIFFNTQAHFTISERKYYKSKQNDQMQLFDHVIENSNLLEKDFTYDQFLNENILLEIKIPFSIQLPINTYPSCFFSGSLAYVTHNLQVEFPILKAYKSVMFIVKNVQHFNKENGLLKEPFEINKNISKSKFLSSKGNFTALIKLDKNYFFYDENIIYDIVLDFSELDLDVNEVIIKIVKTIQKNFKTNHEKPLVKLKDDVATHKIVLDKNIKEFHFKDGIKIDKKHNPILVYEEMEKNGPYKLEDNKNKKEFFLTPCCYGGLLSVSYELNIKIIFDSLLTFNEEFIIPLDFIPHPNNNDENKIQRIKKEHIDFEDAPPPNSIFEGK